MPLSGSELKAKTIIALSILYWVLLLFSQNLRHVKENVWMFWPAEAYTLVILMFLPKKEWWKILVPFTLVKLIFGELIQGFSLFVNCAAAFSDTMEPWMGAWIIGKFFKKPSEVYSSIKGIFIFFTLGVFIPTAIGGVIGGGAVALDYKLPFLGIWQTWWFANVVGCTILAPCLISCWNIYQQKTYKTFKTSRNIEFAILVALVLLASLLAFGIQPTDSSIFIDLPFILYPLLIWGAVRFHVAGLTVLCFVMCSVSTLLSLSGRGPFLSFGGDMALNILAMQLFLYVTTVSFLILSIIIEKEQFLTAELVKARDYLEAVVEQRTEQLIVEKENAEKANLAKSQFLANMSHEIRTPMNSIMGFAEILQKKEDEPKKVKYLNSIHSSGASLLNLINEILDLSKIEAGKINVCYSPVCLRSLAADVLTMFKINAEQRGLEIEMEVVDDFPDCLSLDQPHLRQVLINLTGNALKFTNEGQIKIKLDFEKINDESGTLLLSVEDTGRGIAKEQFDKIFNSFEQGDEMVPGTYGGTGLGLAISQKLTELMNGRILVASELGKGSVFTIKIEAVEILEGLSLSSNSVADKMDISFESSKVLIVDDIENNRNILIEYLHDQPFEIRQAVNGQEAFDMLGEFQPDVILLDMKMPVMNGYEFSEKVRQEAKYKDIKIIAITASALKEDQDVISEICDYYLPKPVLSAQLMKALIDVKIPYRENKQKSKTESPVDFSEEAMKLLRSELEDAALQALIEQSRQSLSITELYKLIKELKSIQDRYPEPEFSRWLKTLQEALDAFNMANAESILNKLSTLKVFTEK